MYAVETERVRKSERTTGTLISVVIRTCELLNSRVFVACWLARRDDSCVPGSMYSGLEALGKSEGGTTCLGKRNRHRPNHMYNIEIPSSLRIQPKSVCSSHVTRLTPMTSQHTEAAIIIGLTLLAPLNGVCDKEGGVE